ncbi:MAG: redoxin domain-containing protein [Phycisphaerae bacterium]|nr:redoxin domain-containing protein [Phycisphaerae bacterium]
MIKSKESRSKTEHSSQWGRRVCLERVNLVAFALAVLAAVLPSPAMAAGQELRLTERVIPVPHPITSLLRVKRVHRELRLTSETITQIEQAADEVDQPLWRLRDLSPDKRNGQAEKLIDQLKRRLSENLTVRQMDRLNQIVWQAQGIEAVLEPEVATRLRLSAEQTANILALLSTAYQKIAEVRLNTQIRSGTVRAAYIQRTRAEAQQNITAVLSAAQQNAFTALIGMPANLSQVQTVACKAPEIAAETWINSSPVRLSDLRGKVTVVHFYAFGCGNCVRSLPYYNEWLKHFDTEPFAIVGIHRPETELERDVERVKEKAIQAGMQYPIAIDNDSLAWEAWGNHTWPTTYLIDKNGFVRYWWYGELNWQGNDSEKYLRGRIQELIIEPARG